MSYTIYGWYKGYEENRFELGMALWLQNQLQTQRNTEVNLVVEDSNNKFYTNEGDVFKIPHHVSYIIENNETKKFVVIDYSDDCNQVFGLTTFKNFAGILSSQYNQCKIDKDIPDESLRKLIVPINYRETNWNFGQYYDTIQEYRKQITLDKRLHFRGSVYPNLRDSIMFLLQRDAKNVCVGGRTQFDEYIKEAAAFKLTLSMGMSPYSSDICYRDIEMFGLGIPVLRPEFRIKMQDQLLPNVHYISCDVELDPYTLWTANHRQTANSIYERYLQVVDDDEFLNYIATNAREWYLKNMTEPVVVDNILPLITI